MLSRCAENSEQVRPSSQVILYSYLTIMEKHPKEMSCEELYIKLKEDSANVKVASTVRGEIVMYY